MFRACVSTASVARLSGAPRAAAVTALVAVSVLVGAAPALAAPGELIFHKAYHPTSVVGGHDVGVAVGYDAVHDAVVVAGNEASTASTTSMYAFSLDLANLLRWEDSWSGLDDARTADLALTAAGDAYVVGTIDTAAHGTDYMLLRKNWDGSFGGAKTYDGPAHKGDAAAAVAVGADGSVYVTGMSRAADGDFDIVTVKYGPAGDRVWARRYNSPSDRLDRGQALFVRANSLYVAGVSRRTGHGDDVVLIRYDAQTGARRWVRFYDDPAHRHEWTAAVVTNGTAVYVCGSGRNSGTAGGNALLLKYAPDGRRVWARYVTGAAGTQDAWVDMKLAPGGRVNVAGFIHRSATGRDILTASYRPDGTRRWQTTLYSSPGNHPDAASALSVDSSGRTYVAGSMYRGTATGQDIVAVCYAANGHRDWYAFSDGGSGGDDAARDVVVSPASVYVTGSYAAGAWGDDIALLRFDR